MPVQPTQEPDENKPSLPKDTELSREVRTRGDGGSLDNDDTITNKSELEKHYANLGVSSKTLLSNSTIQLSNSSNNLQTNVHYGSLGRSPKINAATSSFNLVLAPTSSSNGNPKSHTGNNVCWNAVKKSDPSNIIGGISTTHHDLSNNKSIAVQRNVASIKNAISNMSDCGFRQSVGRAHLRGAVLGIGGVSDDTLNTSSSRQDSHMLDASFELQNIKKQTEIFRQQLQRNPSTNPSMQHQHIRPNAQTNQALHGPECAFRNTATTASAQVYSVESCMRKNELESVQEHHKLQRDFNEKSKNILKSTLCRNSDENCSQTNACNLSMKENNVQEAQQLNLDDTIRLEPSASPLVTSTSFNETKVGGMNEISALEETPGRCHMTFIKLLG